MRKIQTNGSIEWTLPGITTRVLVEDAVMNEIQDRLRAVQTRRSSVAAKRARDEIEAENAATSLASARAALLSEFGVSTGADLGSVRAKLEKELETTVSELETQLTASEA